jgi:hypothetical protein
MIIERFIGYIAQQIKDLNFVEVYGGVTRLHQEKTIENQELGITVYKKFPISCAVEGDVAPGKRVQRFRDLIPSDQYKSMLYWEILQGMQDRGGFAANRRTAPNESQRVMQGRARLVGWLNSQALGQTVCNSAADAIFALLPIFKQTLQYPIIPIENAQVEFRVIGEVIRDFSIFSKYTYEPMQHTFFYPFDFFAIDVQIEAIIPLGCIPDFPIANPLPCVDYTVVS